jgi:hypothetical protein
VSSAFWDIAVAPGDAFLPPSQVSGEAPDRPNLRSAKRTPKPAAEGGKPHVAKVDDRPTATEDPSQNPGQPQKRLSSRMKIWERRAVATTLILTLLLTPIVADTFKLKLVSSLVGGQDSKSKELLSLSPDAADRDGRRDLLLVLQSSGKFMLINR